MPISESREAFQRSFKVAVSGPTGFIGRFLSADLRNRGCRVEALARSECRLPEGVVVHRIGDLSRQPQVERLLSTTDAVVHCAGRSQVARRERGQADRLYEAANVQATAWLAEQAARAGVRRFVFLSTAKVQGETTSGEQGFREEDMPAPVGAYACSKLQAEEALWEIGLRHRMEIVVIRPPVVYGPGVGGLLLQLLRFVALGLPLPVSALENRRSLIAVQNLSDFVARVLAHPAARDRTFLVSDDDDVSTAELIRRLATALGRPARCVRVSSRPIQLLEGLLGRSGVSDRLFGSLCLDISRAHTELDWHPPVSLQEGLEAMAGWYLTQRAAGGSH